MKDYGTLQVDYEEPVLYVTFDRPGRANAMNPQMDKELDEVMSSVNKNPGCRFVVFTGAGTVFSAGADLKELAESIADNPEDSSWIRQDQIHRQEFLRKFDTIDQITVAAINGPAIGAGMALAMACDFRLIAEEAALSLPEVDRGMFFSGGGTPRLVNLVGAAKAKELIMLGDEISAHEAKSLGLVTKVIPAGQLPQAVEAFVSKLASKPFEPLKLTKKIINASAPRFENLLYYEADLQEQVLMQGGALEQIQKFTNRSKNTSR